MPATTFEHRTAGGEQGRYQEVRVKTSRTFTDVFLLGLVAQTRNHSIKGQRIRISRSSLATWPAEGQLELYETQIFFKRLFLQPIASKQLTDTFAVFSTPLHSYTQAMECGEDLFSGRGAGQLIHGDAMPKWFDKLWQTYKCYADTQLQHRRIPAPGLARLLSPRRNLQGVLPTSPSSPFKCYLIHEACRPSHTVLNCEIKGGKIKHLKTCPFPMHFPHLERLTSLFCLNILCFTIILLLHKLNVSSFSGRGSFLS